MDMQRYEDVDVDNDIDEDYGQEDQDSSIEETQNKSGSSKL